MRICPIVLLFFSTALFSSESPRRAVEYWDLPTGSHIAYVRYPSRPPEKHLPIVFLHGGPGAYIVDHPAIAEEFYESLAALGFDVYIYDQIGGGRSARLADPRQYSLDRHIRDLEAIRQQIGALHMILIGDSWGATLGANYIAEHPDRCVKAIFSSPGALDPSELPAATYADAPMTKAAEAWFASIYVQPRYSALSGLKESDVVSVHRAIPDQEMDRQLDGFVQRTLPFLVCDPTKLPADLAVHGMGWWVNLMTSLDLAQHRRNPRPKLARAKIPVLVLRGGCDYMRWEVAYQYKSAFPRATLLYVPDAGHAFGYDQPKIYASAVRTFLLDQPLPLEPYMRSASPPRVQPRGIAPNGQ